MDTNQLTELKAMLREAVEIFERIDDISFSENTNLCGMVHEGNSWAEKVRKTILKEN